MTVEVAKSRQNPKGNVKRTPPNVTLVDPVELLFGYSPSSFGIEQPEHSDLRLGVGYGLQIRSCFLPLRVKRLAGLEQQSFP